MTNPHMLPIPPPLSIYNHVNSQKFEEFLGPRKNILLTKPPSFSAVSIDTEKIRDPCVVEILNKTANVSNTHPMWWAIVYQCYLSVEIVGFLHSLELGSDENIYIIETPCNHFFYSVGHPLDSSSILYDPQEAVYKANGIENNMTLGDYFFEEDSIVKFGDYSSY